MIKEIKYNGFTETPSDYSCPDGDLATAIGLVHEDEGLKPLQPPVLWFTMPDGYNMVYVHRNTGYLHYIVRNDKSFYWMDEHEKPAVIEQSELNHLITLNAEEIYDCNSIGNTLIILASDGIHYFLWKADSSTYKSLGMHIPEVDISFGLQSSITVGDWVSMVGKVDESYIEDVAFGEDKPQYTNEKYIDWVTENVMAAVNKRIEKKRKEGKFIFPFLVRYAYRLYDETLSMHSVPALMVTDSNALHCFIFPQLSLATDHQWYICTLDSDLDYELRTNVSEKLKDWGDIVKSVDIFISAPIWTFNQAEKVVGQTKREYYERSYSISKYSSDPYKKFFVVKLLADNAGNWDGTPLYYGREVGYTSFGKTELLLKRYSESEMKEKINSCHDFYLLKSIPIDELLYKQRTKIEVPENYLTTLVNREVMTDDYDSHALLSPRFSFVYNSRLTISNIKKWVADAPSILSAICYNEQNNSSDFGGLEGNALYEIFVYLKADGRTIVTKDTRPLTDYMAADGAILYYFYPDPNAFKAVFHRRYYGGNAGYQDDYFSIALKKHDFLNGAVFFNGWSPNYTTESSAPVLSEDRTIELPNKMYTSEVGNSFVFLSAGINTIGVSDIKGIRPAVKAMSPSQFGQFKFYVFSSDGVWALEVSSSGYLEKPQLVAPDIVLGEGESITQIDGAVLFASERGIMMLSGSTCSCISEILTSPSPFLPFAANAENDLLPGLRSVCSDSLNVLTSIVPFRQFIQDCQMFYNYTHQRIILFSPSHSYAYVFSLKSKLWTMMQSDIKHTVNYFPNALVYNSDGNIVNYSEDAAFDVLSYVNGTIITRPFKLEPQDALKTITSIIQRGQFRKGHVKTILYGSRDLFNWQLVWSSEDHYLRGFSGTPYKYYRLALLCSMSPDESIFGCSIDFLERYTNRLR